MSGEATLFLKTVEENVVVMNNLITTSSCISRHANFSLRCKPSEVLQAINNIVSKSFQFVLLNIADGSNII